MNYNQLAQTAQSVLEKNWNGHFTKPAPSLYPHQWNWDSGFIALGVAHYHWERAEAELRHLFQAQWSTGMLPQIVFGNDPEAKYFPGPDFWQTQDVPAAPTHIHTSGITQPPVFGFILWEMYQIAKDKDQAKAFLQEMYPKVVALHRYFYEFRDPKEEGLVYIRHPWEAGTDNSPTWDTILEKLEVSQLYIPPYQRKDLQNPDAAKHRPTDLDYDRYVYLVDLYRRNNYDDKAIEKECPFKIVDPLFNAVLTWSNEALIKIGELLNEDVTEIVQWYELTTHMMNEKLWDEEYGIYNGWDLVEDKVIPIETSSGLMPLIGGIPEIGQALEILDLLSSEHFAGNLDNPVYLCPTYSLTCENFDYSKYWRGPVWMNMNWMLYHGLRRYETDEFLEVAERIKKDSLDLLNKYGFYEYFDPRKNATANAGYGTNQFSWSAALCLAWLKDDNT